MWRVISPLRWSMRDLEGSALMHYAGTPKPYHVGGSTTKWTVDKDYNTRASHNQAEDKFLGFTS